MLRLSSIFPGWGGLHHLVNSPFRGSELSGPDFRIATGVGLDAVTNDATDLFNRKLATQGGADYPMMQEASV
jgi:hypothetical protein